MTRPDPTLRFERIKERKSRPKRALRTKDDASLYDPEPLKAAGQHIGTERLSPELVTAQNNGAAR